MNIRNKSVTNRNPKSTVAPKVHHHNFRKVRCLFRYCTDAGYVKLIVGI